MEQQEIIEYLKNNLRIYITQNTEFGPVETINITLELDGEIINESSCDLPSKD